MYLLYIYLHVYIIFLCVVWMVWGVVYVCVSVGTCEGQKEAPDSLYLEL